ncbi:MAG: hypothetical protein ACTSVI_04140 [Promethearchaeota archaeon]
MGLFQDKKDILNDSFSFDDLCEVCHFSEEEHKEVRNLLKSWAKRGYVRRLSKNMYKKLA